jgi:hypothetical protein
MCDLVTPVFEQFNPMAFVLYARKIFGKGDELVRCFRNYRRLAFEQVEKDLVRRSQPFPETHKRNHGSIRHY